MKRGAESIDMGNIWVTSDLHLYHNKDFLYGPRGFDSIYEMNAAVSANWNNSVTMEDDVYVLGDLMLNDNAAAAKILSTLKGKIHVVLGNHDSEERCAIYEDLWNVVEVERAIPLKYKGQRFYLTHYPTLIGNYDEHSLRQSVINLCGHSHTKDPFLHWEYGLIYHCELDAHDNKPILLDDVMKEVKEKFDERL